MFMHCTNNSISFYIGRTSIIKFWRPIFGDAATTVDKMAGLPENTGRQVPVAASCLAIVLGRCGAGDVVGHRMLNRRSRRQSSALRNGAAMKPENGYRIFLDFVDTNRSAFGWNPTLVASLDGLDFVGFVRPGTLFVSAEAPCLENLRNAWARRILKPPSGFVIKSFGDVNGIEMHEVPQTQFIPLSDVLCTVISALNRIGQPATIQSIMEALRQQYVGMTIPKEDMIYAAIGGLMAQGRLYCMGNHYFISTPFVQLTNPAFCMGSNPYFWNAEDTNVISAGHYSRKIPRTLRTTETCSKECQTGNSIVAGPAYRPPVHKAAISQTNQNAAGQCHRVQTVTTKQKPINTKQNAGEKTTSLWKRLFGRSKEKKFASSCSHQADSGRQNEFTSSTNNRITTPVDNVAVGDWVPDLQYVRALSSDPYNQMWANRLKKQARGGAHEAWKNRHSIWMDCEMAVCRRQRADHRFASHRYSTRFEQEPPPFDGFGRSSKGHIRRRLNRFISSSSECLFNSGHANNPYCRQMAQDFTRHNPLHRTKQLNLHNISAELQLNNGGGDAKVAKETFDDDDDDGDCNVDAKRATVDCNQATLGGSPALLLLGNNSMLKACQLMMMSKDEDGDFKNVDQNAEHRDSALSVSPVITDASSSDTKFSSWSGSDSRHEPLTVTENPSNNKCLLSSQVKNKADHTYMNDTGRLECTLASHTYENLSFALNKLDQLREEQQQKQQPQLTCNDSDTAESESGNVPPLSTDHQRSVSPSEQLADMLNDFEIVKKEMKSRENFCFLNVLEIRYSSACLRENACKFFVRLLCLRLCGFSVDDCWPTVCGACCIIFFISSN
ncbi:Storkhead-box protein 1 [Trichinella pseudospiralis]|uniref:Storkhead-box protein 1 n=1 Tax=Trichinella pseudospiralis TaxID=6337 RepID=A0A0V1E311_TRIPS|nr:Storkhead-box protein 1 [Trichinella pseudospiralis]